VFSFVFTSEFLVANKQPPSLLPPTTGSLTHAHFVDTLLALLLCAEPAEAAGAGEWPRAVHTVAMELSMRALGGTHRADTSEHCT
jgi:hypothetical protein